MINLVRAVPGKKVLGGTELEKGVPPTQFYLYQKVYGHSFPRTFVPTRFLTGSDICAHIK